MQFFSTGEFYILIKDYQKYICAKNHVASEDRLQNLKTRGLFDEHPTAYTMYMYVHVLYLAWSRAQCTDPCTCTCTPSDHRERTQELQLWHFKGTTFVAALIKLAVFNTTTRPQHSMCRIPATRLRMPSRTVIALLCG